MVKKITAKSMSFVYDSLGLLSSHCGYKISCVLMYKDILNGNLQTWYSEGTAAKKCCPAPRAVERPGLRPISRFPLQSQNEPYEKRA